MPRNTGTGFYSLPPNLTAIAGDVIKSANWNALLSDLSTVFNQPIPVSLGGTGVASLPALMGALGALPLSGGTMTGFLTLSGNATASLHPVTKQQFDAALLGKADASHVHSSVNITDFSAAVTAVINATAINALSDVIAVSPVANDVLRYNGSAFVNTPLYSEYNLGTLAANTSYTQAHGLGTTPSHVEWYFKCKVSDASYAVGDYLAISSLCPFPNVAAPFFTTSTVGLTTRASVSFVVVDKVARTDVGVTLSSWDVVARVFN